MKAGERDDLDLDTLAYALVYGGGRFLEAILTGDRLDYQLRVMILNRAQEITRDRDDELALAVVNRLAEAMG